MILDVSPTRMELLRLKKKNTIAKRGHKLLKDKLDEFVRLILILVKQSFLLREEVEKKISEADMYLALSRYAVFPEAMESVLVLPGKDVRISIIFRQLLNLKVPEFALHDYTGWARTYSHSYTSCGLDKALQIYDTVIEKIIELSEIEKRIMMISEEIMKTRRRVNALEYILIPNIGETIRYISMKLDEQERNTQAQLMRIKDVVRVPMAQTSGYPGTVKFVS